MSDDPSKLIPTEDQTPTSIRAEQAPTGDKLAVPEDIVNAGHDTDEPRADSPETPSDAF